MKRLFIVSVLMLLPIIVCADVVEIDGIRYNLASEDNSAVVVRKVKDGYSQYHNDIILPETIEFNGVNYTVSSIGEYAFYGSDITSIIIPNSVKSIEKNILFLAEI